MLGTKFQSLHRSVQLTDVSHRRAEFIRNLEVYLQMKSSTIDCSKTCMNMLAGKGLYILLATSIDAAAKKRIPLCT